MAFREKFAQPFHSAADTLLCGVVGRAEGLANFAKGFVLKVAKQDSSVVFVAEAVQGFVEQRGGFVPSPGRIRN